jgi:spore germination cell wall hydrolase CwlJ-like protein
MNTDERCLIAICCYHEAQGEIYPGKVAVCQVIMERMKRRRQSARQVVFSDKQFSWANDGKRPPVTNYNAFAECLRAVEDTIQLREGGICFDHADHYYNPEKCNPSWVSEMDFVATVGHHRFLRSK